MPDIFGFPTEAELRGQQASPMLTGYARPSQAELDARDAAARAGNGSVTMSNGQQLTGDAFRMSTDPAVVALREQMLMGGKSDPNLLFGGTDGRQQSDAERQYRHDYHNFMRNPNSGVDHNEALRSLGLFALAPIAGYALGPGAGAGAAGAGGAAAPAAGAGGATITAGEAVIGGAGAAGTAALNASVPSIAPLLSSGAGFAGYGSMGGMQPNAGNGVFANGGVGGMADVGAGNMGSLVNSMAGGGGFMSSLLNNAGSLQSLLGGSGGGEQGGGQAAPMPVSNSFMGSIPMPQRSTRQTTPLNQDVTRMRGYSRTPYSFNGATVWL